MENAEHYVDALYAADPALERVKAGIVEHGMPEISVAPGYGRLLTILAALAGGERALEIGALGGYSGICICRGLKEGGKLISLELDRAYADLALANVRAAGLGDRVEYKVGEALDSLRQLHDEGQTFDFIFIDADKGNYPAYLDWAIRLAHPGTVITGDNAMMNGRALHPVPDAPSVTAMREFNRRIAEDPRLQSTILTAYDGLAVARVK